MLLGPQDFLFWWQNRFPEMSAVYAPYIRCCISRQLSESSVFCLRMAYFEYRLQKYVTENLRIEEQFDWLAEESTESLLDGLSHLRLDSLVKHLSNVRDIPNHSVSPVIESLRKRLNDYCGSVFDELVQDFEEATGQSVDTLQLPVGQSIAATESDQRLSLDRSVRQLLEFVERADSELSELMQLTATADSGAADIRLKTKNRCRAFFNEVERRFSRVEGAGSELADSWLLSVLQFVEDNPECFGH